LFAGLKELGLDEKTLVIFTSDNGAHPTFNDTRSGGLRDGKRSLREGGIRMPFIVRWPGCVPAGRVDDKAVLHAVDLFPSFCKLAGARLPHDVKFDGEEMSSKLLGKTGKRQKAMFWEFGSYTPLKTVYPSPNLAVRRGEWKLLVNVDGTATELYNIEKDRGETTNLAEKNPAVTKRLTKTVLKWKDSLP
jgi:arylsulfatase A-like enzyme